MILTWWEWLSGGSVSGDRLSHDEVKLGSDLDVLTVAGDQSHLVSHGLDH